MTGKKPGIECTLVERLSERFITIGTYPCRDYKAKTKGVFLTDTELSALKEQHAKELEEAFKAGRKGYGSQIDDTGMYAAFTFDYDDYEDYKKNGGGG